MIACFLDIQKAYDSVDRRKLFTILKELGIKDKMLNWLKEFLLTKRECNVLYKKKQDQKRTITIMECQIITTPVKIQ